MFHKHNWELLESFKTKCIAEMAHELNLTTSSCNRYDLVYKEVRIFQCTECGKLKTIKVDSVSK